MIFDNDNPLNRTKGESIKAHTALMDYWKMGGGRSFEKLRQEYLNYTLERPPTVHLRVLSNWSSKFRWQDRISRQKEIDDALALEQYRERHMSADEVIARLSDQARADISNFVKPTEDEEGNTSLALDWGNIEKYGHLIKSITSTRYGPKIEFNDPQKALELIGKDHGRFKDRIDITSGDRPFTIDDLARAIQELDDWNKGDENEDYPQD